MKSKSIHRLLSALLSIILTLALLGGCEQTARNSRVVPDQPATTKSDPCFGPLADHAKIVRSLVDDQRFNAAQDELTRIAKQAQQQKADGEWAWALVEAAQIDSVGNGASKALQTLHSQPWPNGLLSRTALSLVAAKFQTDIIGSGPDSDVSAPEDDSLKRDDVLGNFREAWQHRSELGSEPMARFAALIEPGNYPKGIRDSLRDLISYSLATTLADERLWDPAEKIAAYQLDLTALASGETRPVENTALLAPGVHPLVGAVAVLSDLEAWHTKRGDREAALEARFERFRVLRGAIGQGPQSISIRQSLETLLKQHHGEAWVAEGYAELAEQLVADSSDPSTVLKAAETGARLFPSSLGGQRCRQMVEEITKPFYSAMGMRTDAPGRPSLLVTYRNLRQLNAYAYPFDLDKGAKRADNLAKSGTMPRLADILSVMNSWPSYAWTVPLAATPDHQNHDLLVTPPLSKPGFYSIALSPHWFFLNDWGEHQDGTLMLSDLRLETQNDLKKGLRVIASSWSTGRPYSNVSITCYQLGITPSGPARKTGAPPPRPGACSRQVVVTDSSGGAMISPHPGDWIHYLLAARSGDQWAFDEGEYRTHAPNPSPRNDSSRTRTIVATDRAIYRPGQKVLWKAFALQGNEEKGEIKPIGGKRISLTLKTHGRTTIASRSLVTNDFGSASGEFQLPGTGLRGKAWIESEGGSWTELRVEEYKRPSFDVSLSAPAARALSRPFNIAGKAKLGFGRPLANGKVRWEIRREEEGDETWGVAGGETSLDSSGTFRIPFDPRTDVPSSATRDERRYSVKALVTSQNGESRSAKLSFYLSSPAVTAKIQASRGFFEPNVAARFEACRLDLNGYPRAGEAGWNLFELNPPASPSLPGESSTANPKGDTSSNPLQPRWAPSPGAETTMHAWPLGRRVRAGVIHHGADGLTQIEAGRLSPGFYRLHYETRDPFGARYETSKDFVVAGRAPLPFAAALFTDAEKVSVGDRLRILIATDLPDQLLRLARYRRDRLIDERILESSQLKGAIELPITEADRGGFDLMLSAIHDHRFLIDTRHIHVPWDRTLTVSLSNPPASVPPASRQAWSVAVESDDGKPVKQAEVLATMVDRSLDAYGTHPLPDLLDETWKASSVPSAMNACSGYAPFSQAGKDLFAGEPPTKQQLVVAHLRDGLSYLGRSAWEYAPVGAAAPSKGVEALHDGRKGSMRRTGGRIAANPLSIPPGEAIRRDYSETAFFLPHLVTNGDGRADFSFDMPDSLTSWNVNLLALTRDFHVGRANLVVQSSRELQVRLALPRFLREGDRALISVEIDNTSKRPLDGKLAISVRDPATRRNLGPVFTVATGAHPFHLKPGESATIPCWLQVPRTLGQVAFKAAAQAGNLSDAEEHIIPILPARSHLALSRSVTLNHPGQAVLSFSDVPPDRFRSGERTIMTVHANLFSALFSALPAVESHPPENIDELLDRFLSAALINRLLNEDTELRQVAQAAAKRKSSWRPFNEPDANRTMLLEETPWLEASRGGKPGISLLEQGAATRIGAEALSRLAMMQSGGGFAWFQGGPLSRRTTLRVLEGLAEASRNGASGGDSLMYDGLKLLVRNYDHDQRYWTKNWDAMISLVYVASSLTPRQRQASSLNERLLKDMLDKCLSHWREATPEDAGRLALALHRLGRRSEALQVWESVMDMLGASTKGPALTIQRSNHRFLSTVSGPAFALRALLELNPTDPRARRLAERLALQMQLAQQRSAHHTTAGLVALTEYLRHAGDRARSHVVTIEAPAMKQRLVFGADPTKGRSQLVLAASDRGVPGPISIRQAARGMTLATATWHFATDHVASASVGSACEISRSYFVLRSKGGQRAWVPINSRTSLELGEEIEARIAFKIPYPLGQICVRDPRPSGFEPEEVFSGERWNAGQDVYEEIRDNRTSFFFERLTEGPHAIKYRMRAATPGRFHVAPATLVALYSPEFQAFSSAAELGIVSDR